MYISILIYQFIPFPTSLPGNHKFVFCVCDSTSVLQISSFVPFFRFHMQAITYICLWLTSFRMRISRSIHVASISKPWYKDFCLDRLDGYQHQEPSTFQCLIPSCLPILCPQFSLWNKFMSLVSPAPLILNLVNSPQPYEQTPTNKWYEK